MTFSVFNQSEKLLQLAAGMFKLYINGGWLGNMAHLTGLLGAYFRKTGEYAYAQIFYSTALQYAIVTKNEDVD